MSTALQEWQQHRLDYRGPALLALLLFVGLGLVLPQDWLDLPWLGPPSTRELPSPRFQFAEEDGLQILDVEILAPAPEQTPTLRVDPERVELTVDPESVPEDLAGEGEFAWDPTHAYRGGQELLVPESAEPQGAVDEMLRRFEFLLSLDGAASYTLSDTSHAALGQANFARLQREIFANNAPIWAYEKAVERYRELYSRMLFDDPLRGPQ